MTRAHAALGGCSTDRTRSFPLVSCRQRVARRLTLAVPSFECICKFSLSPCKRQRYDAPQLTPSSVSNYGATINEMLFIVWNGGGPADDTGPGGARPDIRHRHRSGRRQPRL